MGDGLPGVEMLRAGLAAVHDSVAPVQLEGVVKFRQALLRELVAAVLDPAIGLHQHRWSKVRVCVPPVTGAGRRAARAENALVHAVQLFPVDLRLQELGLAIRLGRLRLQPGLDRLVLRSEVGHVWHEILDHVHVWQRVELHGVRARLIDVRQAREGVGPVDIHRAATANALAAAPPEGERGIHLVLNLQQGIQDHRSALVHIDRICRYVRLLVLVRVVPVYLEDLDVTRLPRRILVETGRSDDGRFAFVGGVLWATFGAAAGVGTGNVDRTHRGRVLNFQIRAQEPIGDLRQGDIG